MIFAARGAVVIDIKGLFAMNGALGMRMICCCDFFLGTLWLFEAQNYALYAPSEQWAFDKTSDFSVEVESQLTKNHKVVP